MVLMKICILLLQAIIMWYRNKLWLLPAFLFLLLPGPEGIAQQTKVLFQVNYATFQMKDLKNMQLDMLNGLEATVDGKVVSSYPSFTGYELNLNSRLGEDHSIGGYAAYYSTGGRIHYQDYSGEIKIDQLLSNYSLGIYNEFVFQHFSKSALLFTTRAGFTCSLYQMQSLFQVGTAQDSDELGFYSLNFHLSPGIGYRHTFGEIFFIQAETRYEIHLPGPFRLNRDKNAKLIDKKGDKIKAQWDGIRIGLSAGLNF